MLDSGWDSPPQRHTPWDPTHPAQWTIDGRPHHRPTTAWAMGKSCASCESWASWHTDPATIPIPAQDCRLHSGLRMQVGACAGVDEDEKKTRMVGNSGGARVLHAHEEGRERSGDDRDGHHGHSQIA